MELVCIAYDDLLAGNDVTEKIIEAYGPGGKGALTISGVPNYENLRRKLLPLSHKLAHLPNERKALLEHAPSMWNVGWSHGKEKLGDKPDLAKGSYYCNPLYDKAAGDDDSTRARYPYAYPDNVWPTDDMPELEPAFKAMGRLMFDVIVLLCRGIDNFVAERVPTYEKGKLYNAIKETKKVKGRLLYYFPCDQHEAEDGWIGWHNDCGFLTGLVSSLYFDDDTGAIIPNPDPSGGLWVVNRGSTPVQVKIPADHMGVQCGECLQVITGGLLVATPHAVRVSKSNSNVRVGRGAFPVFVDTDVEFLLATPPGVERGQVFDKTVHSKVPPLESRWKGNDQKFVEFLGDTFRQYYEWNGSNAM